MIMPGLKSHGLLLGYHFCRRPGLLKVGCGVYAQLQPSPEYEADYKCLLDILQRAIQASFTAQVMDVGFPA
jgi:hypothetical protein